MSKKFASFEEERDYYKKRRTTAISAAKAAFKKSPAVIVTENGRDPELYILSGDIVRPAGAGSRITFFSKDGPRGHHEGSVDELMEYIAGELNAYQPVGDAEVIAWTSTPEFIEGSKHVAYRQLWNEIGWLASKLPDEKDRELAYSQRRAADDLATTDLERATAMLRRVVLALPRPNPASGRFRPNPTPWVTQVLAEVYEELEEAVPPAWLPKITSARVTDRATFTGQLEEFGCGAYGCVLPTLDRSIVLKVTTDESEAEFAQELAGKLPTDIVTKYHRVIPIRDARRGPRDGIRRDDKGYPIFLLWREEAQDVGKIDTVVGDHAEEAIHAQHAVAKELFLAHLGKAPASAIRAAQKTWIAELGQMAKIRELAFVADGLRRAALEQGIWITDVHGGNLGRAQRNGAAAWIITDPGNVIVERAARTNPSEDPDDVLVYVVMDTARSVPEHERFGGRKVFISDLYDALERLGRLGGADRDELKSELVRLHRAGKITLARADLVAAMPPRKVAASETVYGPATFHFVVL